MKAAARRLPELRAVRRAHPPGDAVVPRGPARLLRPWQSASWRSAVGVLDRHHCTSAHRAGRREKRNRPAPSGGTREIGRERSTGLTAAAAMQKPDASGQPSSWKWSDRLGVGGEGVGASSWSASAFVCIGGRWTGSRLPREAGWCGPRAGCSCWDGRSGARVGSAMGVLRLYCRASNESRLCPPATRRGGGTRLAGGHSRFSS
jgi:hypothetical protein